MATNSKHVLIAVNIIFTERLLKFCSMS